MTQAKNIFRDGNQRFKQITETYSLKEVLVVAIEVGKYNSKGLISDMYGDIVLDEFDFPNTQQGYKYLKAQIQRASSIAKAQKIFIGMEGTGHYHENLALQLKTDSFTVDILAPDDSKKEREHKNAKTDTIDLASIARMLITNKGKRSFLSDGIYSKLKIVSRNRRKLVNFTTILKNKITAILDIIFPGYWPKDEEIFSDHWGKASLLILEHYPHPQQIRLMGVKRLSRFLKKHNTKLGEETAKALVLAAENSLCRPKSQTDSHCLTLKSLIQIYRVTTENIEILEREMARLLIQTPGVYLLSIAGISVKFAGEFVAEIGPIDRFCQPQQIMSFAGNVPYVSQSAQYEGVGLPLTKKGAKGLRPLLNQIALSLNTHSPQFKAYYQKKYFQKADRPGIAKIATANKFIRLAFCLMKNRTLFVPEGFDPKLHDLEQHHLSVYKEILNKLKASGINPEEMLSLEQNFLQKIKNDLEKAYGIERLCG